ncbi:MAG: DUF5330 domain-containing protein [Variibacter sp.]|nr:DUF5330 domain-containing protein [Variibacter sp.]
MFFLLRVAFWLSIVVLLLPTGQTGQTQKTSEPAIGAADAVSAAAAALSDMRQFCTRQPEACTVGAQAAHAFGQKAQAGAKMVYDFLTETLAQEPADAAAKAAAPRAPSAKASQNTLTADDLAVPWHGPFMKSAESARRPG